MKKLFTQISLTVLLAFAAVTLAPSSAQAWTDSRQNFSVRMPDNFEIKKLHDHEYDGSGEGFSDYKIRNNGIDYVGIYVGDAPSASNLADEMNVDKTKTPGKVVYKKTRGGVVVAEEILIRLHQNRSPKYLHAWTFNLNKENAQLAVKILETITAKKSNW